MKQFSEKKIIDSWKNNVTPWVKAIRAGEIASRVQVTNQAIVDAVLKFNPATILDIGCGEGWLVRALEQHDISACGIDVIPEFIAAAQQQGVGRFQLLGYEDISDQSFDQKFDLLVCNFSLLGDSSVQHLFRMASTLLNPDGGMIVQTLHPLLACGEADYQDGWRVGSWQGFSAEFRDPAPWYFRTIESWQALFTENGFQPVRIDEPVNPATQKPASIILSARLK
jgi:2-polyprenyl-3-methyl-5-hydroxy-6-metoxy-1,4-benzoquinol methylase